MQDPNAQGMLQESPRRSTSFSEYHVSISDSSSGNISRLRSSANECTRMRTGVFPWVSAIPHNAEGGLLPTNDGQDARHSTDNPIQDKGTLSYDVSNGFSSIEKRRDRRKSTLTGWWWETASVTLSAICVALIVILLGIMDGKPLAEWNLPIKPNSVIAILSTVARSSLLVPIAECISQLKWVYFLSSARSLNLLQVFDDASRGPWGALAFLWKTRFTAVIATAGAVITIIALAFEPTAQQIIEYPSRNAPLTNATSSIANATSFYSAWEFWYGLRNEYITVNNLVASMFSKKALIELPQINCPTLDCRWKSHSTFGVCPSCRNYTISASDLLNCNYTFRPYNDDVTGYNPYPTRSFDNFTTLQVYRSTHEVDSKFLYADCSYGQPQNQDLRDSDGIDITSVPKFELKDMYFNYIGRFSTQTVIGPSPKIFTIVEAKTVDPETTNWDGNVTTNITLCQLEYCIHHYDDISFQNRKLSEKSLSTENLAFIGTGRLDPFHNCKVFSDARNSSSSAYKVCDYIDDLLQYIVKQLRATDQGNYRVRQTLDTKNIMANYLLQTNTTDVMANIAALPRTGWL